MKSRYPLPLKTNDQPKVCFYTILKFRIVSKPLLNKAKIHTRRQKFILAPRRLLIFNDDNNNNTVLL